MEYIERVEGESAPGSPPLETVLGEFRTEEQAIEQARRARSAYLRSDRPDYAWWIVRRSGGHLAEWISDSRSDSEFVLDIRTGELTKVT